MMVTGCAICGKPAEDVHHINQQSYSDESGFIGHHHKNHRYNLIPLCKEHHDATHSGGCSVKGFVMTSNGLELHYDMKKQEN